MTFADRPFQPAFGLHNGHVMTIAAWGRPRRYPDLPAPAVTFLQTTDDTRVRADLYLQPTPSSGVTLLGLHGLEGSSESHYMRGIAQLAWRRGWNVVLLNQRNCGGTEHLTPWLYHSGLTHDPLTVLRQLVHTHHLPAIVIVGYSLGGNLTMRLAAEASQHLDLPIRAAAAVNPTIDLARCVDAIEWPSNRLYQWNFMRGLRARLQRKAALFPGRFDLEPLSRISTIRAFDDAYTAPMGGFGDAATYYRTASALATADRTSVPALILASEDDPFVPADQFRASALRSNPHIQVRVERHGGHCAFVARDWEYWAETTVVDWLGRVVERRQG
jgi:predicted alpha/beta-fold hydrolase